LSVSRIQPEQASTFARVVCDAFDLGDAAIPRLGAIVGREGWLDFGATAPKFRKQGSQAALLAARIEHARGPGCRALYTCSGEEVPGDPQHSYRNITRAGFRELEVKDNYAPPKP